MAIDNPYDAIDEQYPDNDGSVSSALSTVFGPGAALGLPIPPLIAGFFGILDSMSTKARVDRGLAFIRQLVEDMQRVQDDVAKMKTDMAEVQSAIRVSIEYDVDEFNDNKRSRYISAITTSISSETKVHDLTSFIQDIEQLGERDLIGLKVLNRIMNIDGDWKDYPPSPVPNSPPKLHPNQFRQRAQELSVAMAHELTGDPRGTDGNMFSREDGLQICYRLQGFGLAEVIETSPREIPISNYCARPTTRGLMLLKLLGEPVPNWNRYFGCNGPL